MAFIALVLFQVLVLDNADYSSAVIPMVYPLFIFSLRRNMSKSLVLLLCFALGLLIDMFSNTGGAHAMALTFIGYLRPWFLESLSPMDSGSEQIEPSVYNMGFRKYITYISILIVIHHLSFFFIELFSWSDFFRTIVRSFLSSIFSVLIIVILQYIFVKKAK